MEHACIATDHKTVLYVATWSYMELHIATYSYMYIHTARCICMELDVYTRSYCIYNSSVYIHLRSEEHTSELQSHSDLVCRLLLEKKKKIENNRVTETECNVSIMIISELLL